jgi:hypothetical protein
VVAVTAPDTSSLTLRLRRESDPEAHYVLEIDELPGFVVADVTFAALCLELPSALDSFVASFNEVPS